MAEGWRFWIDRGGTFTDILGLDPDGHLHARKLLSDNPDQYADAASHGLRQILGLDDDTPIAAGTVQHVRMGTTVATNALLERKLAKTLLVTTKGFADAIIIDDQTRPDIFALDIHRPEPLFADVLEVDERLGMDGKVLLEPDWAKLAKRLRKFRKAGFESVAICFVHGSQYSDHEIKAAELAKAAGFAFVTDSRSDPRIKFVPRAATSVMDAALTPVLQKGTHEVARRLDGVPLYFMKSSGGLAASDSFTGREAVLSGPAGGVVAMAKTAQAEGYEKVIGFDMGGTSTDVSRASGERLAMRGESKPEGYRLRAPMLDIHTIAAGGGSILHVAQGRAQAGPESAGAQPGPACYGRGGPATITDANLVLGRLHVDSFPNVFGQDGDQPLDEQASRSAIAKLAKELGTSVEEAAEGFLSIAAESMAQAVRKITIEQGEDPADYAMSSFGGAGGQMACLVAERLGISTVLIHPQASLLSALGMGLSAPDQRLAESVDLPLDQTNLKSVQAQGDTLAADACAMVAKLVAEPALAVEMEIDLRLAGSDTAIRLPMGSEDELRAGFAERFAQIYGFAPQGDDLRMETVHVRACAKEDTSIPASRSPMPGFAATRNRMWVDGGMADVPVIDFGALSPGEVITGPALIVQQHSQIVVHPGWAAEMRPSGMLVMTGHARIKPRARDTQMDPVTLEIFNRRYMGIAEQMGSVLARTAHSVNMKERLDFSCAVFDANGGLVANAPHMPVHLGSMSASVHAVMAAHPDLGQGDAVALNSPFAGGTHIPDITVVEPVFDRGGELCFFVAARGHHADIGGIQPGSMPPFSTRIEEEGVQFDAVKIVAGGKFQQDTVREILASGPYPARNPSQNIADLKAQVAACATGRRALLDLVAREGKPRVQAYMGHIQTNAADAVRELLGSLQSGSAEMPMDCSATIKVDIRVDKGARKAVVDFSGTSPAVSSNFNAPRSVARAAVLYVFRVLSGADIPLNEGCLEPLEIIIPEASLLDPPPGSAVVAGNVETSQHVVDALFLASGRLAAAQGTMNNFTFGNARHQYYETIAGGAGASENADGCDAVHTHMTNSSMTDVEVLEHRFPVRVLRHEIRRGSGGDGYNCGGDGCIREVQFLEPMQVALLSSRRESLPPGIGTAEWGMTGAQWVTRANGKAQDLPGCFQIDVEPGDTVAIETPSGGGFGG